MTMVPRKTNIAFILLLLNCPRPAFRSNISVSVSTKINAPRQTMSLSEQTVFYMASAQKAPSRSITASLNLISIIRMPWKFYGTTYLCFLNYLGSWILSDWCCCCHLVHPSHILITNNIEFLRFGKLKITTNTFDDIYTNNIAVGRGRRMEFRAFRFVPSSNQNFLFTDIFLKRLAAASSPSIAPFRRRKCTVYIFCFFSSCIELMSQFIVDRGNQFQFVFLIMSSQCVIAN